jgi:hypothetical protein
MPPSPSGRGKTLPREWHQRKDLEMPIDRRLRAALLASSLGLSLLSGCDYDSHPTATGKTVQPPETTGVDDPGKVNAGGPGAQGQTPK